MREQMGQSQHVDAFNHDPWAAEYDDDVRNEEDPIRAGYNVVLDWVVANAQIQPTNTVIDLGIGTGNTSQRITNVGAVIGVDISSNMMDLARPKLVHLPSVHFVKADLLGFFTQPRHFDALISTYAIHHLTEPEKVQLFDAIYRALAPGGRAVFGDLMFADTHAETALRQHYQQSGDSELVETFDEEFFWYVDHATAALQQSGFNLIDVKQFSALSWGIAATKPAKYTQG